jgi:hypothetical protein
MQLGRKAVSPLIATVLVTLFGVITLGIALGVVNPTFRRAQDTSAVNDQFATLETLNAAVKEVASEPDGSRRVVPITVTAGTLRVNSTYDWLYFEYEPLETLGISGTKGDIRIDQGLEFVDYFSSYADGATATPVWTNVSGQAVASSGAYSITNGTAYHNVSTLENWKFSSAIANVSGASGGEAFALPGNPESLVGYWTGDEATGNTFYDWSGHGNTGGFVGNSNGTLTNMNTTGNATSGWQSGASCKYGSCLKFDGVNDYVAIPDNLIDVGSNYTVSFWLNPVNTPSGNSRVISIVNGASCGSGTCDTLQLGYYATGGFYYRLKTTSVKTGNVLTMLSWYHITFVNNGTGKYAYINGAYVPFDGGSSISANATFSAIGGGYSASSYTTNGTMDDVKFWNRTLGEDEISSEFNGARAGETLSAATNTTGLVGWWKFNEGSGSSAADDSMRAYGKYSSAIKFDGVNDYADVGKSGLDPSGAITISSWINPGLTGSTYNTIARKVNSYIFRLQTNGALAGYIYSGEGFYYAAGSGTGIISSNSGWKFVAMTYDSTDGVRKTKLYVNGVEVPSYSTQSVVPGGIDQNSNDVFVGSYAGTSHFFNGTIDEVMIFNRSLSADEVAALYETSAKKLSGAGGSQSIAAKTPNPAIVLSNPAGQTRFDNVEVTRSGGKLTLMVPYTNVELNGTLRLQKGEHRVQIRHMATNATTNKPIIELTAV